MITNYNYNITFIYTTYISYIIICNGWMVEISTIVDYLMPNSVLYIYIYIYIWWLLKPKRYLRLFIIIYSPIWIMFFCNLHTLGFYPYLFPYIYIYIYIYIYSCNISFFIQGKISSNSWIKNEILLLNLFKVFDLFTFHLIFLENLTRWKVDKSNTLNRFSSNILFFIQESEEILPCIKNDILQLNPLCLIYLLFYSFYCVYIYIYIYMYIKRNRFTKKYIFSNSFILFFLTRVSSFLLSSENIW